MLLRSLKAVQRGFTIVEVLVALTLSGLVATLIFSFFSTTINQYFTLQADGLSFGSLSMQSQRIATVTRGLVDITDAQNSELTMYAYFSPRDETVSLIRYYKSVDGDRLLADVTPMTANLPAGTPVTADKQTYTIVDPFYTLPGVNTFTYFDSGGTQISAPVTDKNTIQQIKISLASPSKAPTPTGYNLIDIQVSLRNRKINL